MNHIKWLSESMALVKRNGYGSVTLTINIKDGREDIIQKSITITDKIHDGYTNSNTSSVVYKLKSQDTLPENK